ncbi:non-ribosomal peptide synthetase [Mucilaginibacter sp. L3T2-6]|uniref:non-ribosomal peptide synthetase n=1 Tax=Mucilaginibacter sp. L3T2-6 TaxID=3062491 RepID=UPI0026747EA8|nr:non-ribosomal peptide synthetase [Mucilaginibacter sp. L3T2-6]MDO3643710.1 non-ribosomal peptide synthetase [Mucilaginibacter sp. L3T2-6]MDV6216042.1 non-ribosomal peptide synthetase [Mucilaginibacter sp. L3T2-6]
MKFETSLCFDEQKLILQPAFENVAFQPFYHLIDECAKAFPDHTAVKFNESYWSYHRLAANSNQFARFLANLGIKKGDVIAIALDRCPEMIVSLLAILKSGATYVPLDPSYPKDRLEYMIEDSSANVLITSKKYQTYFNSEAKELFIEDAWEQFEHFGSDGLNTLIAGDDTAYILYTSGSTGKPKGVIVTHESLSNFLLSMQKAPGIGPHDRLLAISTISFDIAGLELFLPLTGGAEIVLASSETAKDGWLLLELMKQEKITIMQATPYTWRMLIAAGWNDFLPVRIITGGEALSKELAEKLLPLCSELWNQYGPTETTVYSTQKLITSKEEITIGKPIDNTRVYILDEALNMQPEGIIGEIFIGGKGVAKGYLNRPDLTSERFLDDPFSVDPGARMYRTGDLGRFNANAEIECLGRSDQQVKIRGFRIELGEIEYVLLKNNGVKEAVAVTTTTTSDPSIIAYVVPADGCDKVLLKDELRQMLSAALPDYMVPNDIIYISSIPVTPNGKIDRKALPDPANENPELRKTYVGPVSETEKQLTEIWQEVMRIKKISTNSDFFALGGRSLLAVQIMARVAKITGKRLPISTLLNNPTIAKLAAYLNSYEVTNGWNSLVALKPEGTKPPVYIIHGEGLNVLYFNDLAVNMDKDQPVYGLQALGLGGEDPPEVMEEIAGNYVREILEQNPEGPYYLAGYSFGGYVAIEMRKQLKALGKDVKVIIFDSDAEKSEFKSLSYLIPRKIKRNILRIISFTRLTIKNPGGTLRHLIKNIRSKRGLKQDSKEFYRQIKQIQTKLRVALRNYSIEPFDDKVYLYKAKICTHYVDDAEFYGWTKYAKKGVEICEVSGDHLSMLLPPNVEQFAVKLQQGMNKLMIK